MREQQFIDAFVAARMAATSCESPRDVASIIRNAQAAWRLYASHFCISGVPECFGGPKCTSDHK